MLYTLQRSLFRITGPLTLVLCLLFSGPVTGQDVSEQSIMGDSEAVTVATATQLERRFLHFAPTEVNDKNRSSLNRIISVDLSDVKLEDALQYIADQGNLRLSYSKDVTLREKWDKPITLQLGDNATVLGALHAAIDNTGLGLKISQHGLLIVHKDGQQLDFPAELDSGEELFQETVTGTVTDAENGDALPGVNIQVEGSAGGTTTNMEGEYSIAVEGEESVLIFSYVGYVREEVTVGDRNVVNISLEPDFARLDEMIVIGYGSVQRSDLTGSVQRVSRETFQNQSMTQLTDMLTGTIAGFNANQSTGAAGGSSMQIRGRNSLTAGTDPMVVVDGAIFNGSLRDINPNDIESIDILKDASSAAIYG
ncbi:MAG: carboxypeptidase-like regulatory domain-containing protein, partial [Balneolales bacterium]